MTTFWRLFLFGTVLVRENYYICITLKKLKFNGISNADISVNIEELIHPKILASFAEVKI